MQDETSEMKKEKNYVEFWKTALNKLKKLTDDAHLGGYYDPIFKQLENRLADNEFRLAVVGQFSSGKSTFINAIIGRDILSHALAETTAAITRIINVKADDPRANTGIIRFQNGTEKKLDDFSQLKTYTTKSSTTYEVAKEIRLVELYIPFIPDGTPLILVDTPGLNGTSGLETITNDLVREANACIYLFQARGLSEKDLDYLKFIRDYQHSFIFVQGFMDDIHSSEGETPESKLQKLKDGLQQNVFGEKNTNYWKVCGVSALQELAGRDIGITRLYQNADHDLTADERLQLRKSSGFSSFREILSKDFSGNKLVQIKYRDTAEAIYSLAREIRNLVHVKLENKQKDWEMSQDAQNLKNLTTRKKKLEKEKRNQEEQLSGCIEGECDKILKECNDLMNEWADHCRAKQDERIDQLDTMKAVTDYQQEFPGILKQEINYWSNAIDRYVNQSFQVLHNLIIQNIERYTFQNLQFLQDGMPIRTAHITLPEQAFSIDQSHMQWTEQLIKAKKEELNREESNLDTSQRQVRRYENNKTSIESQIDAAADIARAKISRLGSRPKPQIRYVHKKRGGLFPNLRDKIFGKNYEPIEDNSNVQEWESKLRRIKNEWAEQKSILQAQENKARSKLKNARFSVDENKQKITKLKNYLQRLRVEYASQKKAYETQLVTARSEYIKSCKKRFKQSIEKYFNDESTGQIRNLMDYLHREIKEEEKVQIRDALEFYRKILEDEISDIGASVENLENQVNAIKAQRKAIDELVTEMEAGLV